MQLFRAVTLFLLLSSLASSAWAQHDKATARQLFFEASDAMAAGDLEKAADLYHRSNELYPAPTAAVGEARALAKLGKLVEAHERYNSVARKKLADDAPPAFQKAAEEARSEVGELESRIPGVVIRLEGDPVATVTVGAREVPTAALGVRWLVNPGTHAIKATAEGYLPFETNVSLAEGDTKEVTIALETDPSYHATPPSREPSPDIPAPKPDAAPGPSDLAVAGYVIGGVGVLSLVAAGVTGGLFVKQKGIVEDECDDANRCSQKGLDAVDSGRTLGWINTGTLFGGIGLVAVGVVMVVVAEVGDDEASARLSTQPLPGGGGLSIDGRF